MNVLLQWPQGGLALLLSAGLLCMVSGIALGQPHMRDKVDFYIETYGEVRPDAEVARAHSVFERVLAVADKSSKRLPKLVVVDSHADPWAIALPSGHIVLSKQAVAICHREANVAEIEARLAFVLGHELAHLAHDDFWHQEVHAFLAAHESTAQLAGLLRTQRQLKYQELEADDKGFIYAAMAGYPVDLLLRASASKAHFFHFWMQQTNTGAGAPDSTAEERVALLRQRLGDLRDKLAFFDFGVRLSHFDYCDDALYFLGEFQKVFPGREVLNNLGYCHLQMARQEMAAERAYFYWLPLILDGETRAAAYTRQGGPKLQRLKEGATGPAEGPLKEAVQYLQQASAADPGYLPARLNLAVAHLYLGKPHQAMAVLAEARDLAPDDVRVRNLEALILYEQSDAGLDVWPTVVATLGKLAESANAPPSLLFNLARLLEVRSQPAEAQGYWNRLAQVAEALPAPIRDIVCRQQSALSPQSCLRTPAKSVRSVPWKWPLPVSGFERLSARSPEALLAGWRSMSFDWIRAKLHGQIYRSPEGGAEVLALDEFVQMQVLRGGPLGLVGGLSGYCGEPLRQRTLAQGEVWSCDDWAALALGEEVKEVWWVAK
jgi:tetratricopeptide (TPR) repeat protein